MPEKYKVLIIGSSGMLGVDLCKELSEDYEIYGMDNRSRAGLNLPYNSAPVAQRFLECDITDKKNVAEVVSKIRPKIVVHTAAMTDVDGCEIAKDRAHNINVVGTENVASACREFGSILIYISTDFVFDGKKKEPYKESDKPGPLNIYAESKLGGEEAVKSILKEYFILRSSWLYGKSGKNFVDTIIEKAKTKKSLKVVDDQAGSPTYTVDLSKAIHVLLSEIMRRDTGNGVRDAGIYHVSNSGAVSWYEYAKEILKISGSDVKVLPISSVELNRPAKRPAMSVLDNSKFTGFTGYKLRDWKEALKDYITKKGQ